MAKSLGFLSALTALIPSADDVRRFKPDDVLLNVATKTDKGVERSGWTVERYMKEAQALHSQQKGNTVIGAIGVTDAVSDVESKTALQIALSPKLTLTSRQREVFASMITPNALLGAMREDEKGLFFQPEALGNDKSTGSGLSFALDVFTAKLKDARASGVQSGRPSHYVRTQINTLHSWLYGAEVLGGKAITKSEWRGRMLNISSRSKAPAVSRDWFDFLGIEAFSQESEGEMPESVQSDETNQQVTLADVGMKWGK